MATPKPKQVTHGAYQQAPDGKTYMTIVQFDGGFTWGKGRTPRESVLRTKREMTANGKGLITRASKTFLVATGTYLNRAGSLVSPSPEAADALLEIKIKEA